MMDTSSTALSLEGVSKGFSGVPVLKNIDFSVSPGEIRALLGANGAGKSTLIKIASGVYSADSGRVSVNGALRHFRSPLDACHAGIAVVHQETSLIPTSSALQNVFMGREALRFSVLLDERTMLREYEKLAKLLGVTIPPDKKVRSLGAAEKKLVEIMKAVSRKSSLMIMDEPTDSLSRHEIESLFSVIRDLKSRGMTIIYITHFLGEVAELADTATVLRDGQVVATQAAKSISTPELVSMMLGRQAIVPGKIDGSRAHGVAKLAVQGLSRKSEFHDISLELRRGEVFGIVGVVGSGKTELARTLSGASRAHHGRMWLDGKLIKLRSPHKAIKAGMGMAPEDRKSQGLVLEHDVMRNVSMASLARFTRMGIINSTAERTEVATALARLSTSFASLSQRMRYLSGGNQQKCVLARWLLAAPDVLILDEPTRGVDVGAKADIYAIVRRIVEEGKSVLYFSGEAQEILAVADRVMVMQKGRIKNMYETPPSEEELLKEMLEVSDER